MVNNDEKKSMEELLIERQIRRQCATISKFYRATKPARGLPPRMKVYEAIREIKSFEKEMTFQESKEFYEEIIKTLKDLEEEEESR